MEAYHRIIPKSEPVEDWEARNALYATYVTPGVDLDLSGPWMTRFLHRRVLIHDSALYPDKPKFRNK
jgi:hypothetical protein